MIFTDRDSLLRLKALRTGKWFFSSPSYTKSPVLSPSNYLTISFYSILLRHRWKSKNILGVSKNFLSVYRKVTRQNSESTHAWTEWIIVVDKRHKHRLENVLLLLPVVGVFIQWSCCEECFAVKSWSFASHLWLFCFFLLLWRVCVCVFVYLFTMRGVNI